MSTSLLRALDERVLVLDGAMGTSLLGLAGPGDFPPGAKVCLDSWCLSSPERVRQVHQGFLEAGCDLIETNTFLSQPLTLAEYGLADQVEELNRTAVRLARHCADAASTPEKPRWILGAMGPGSRLPSLGQVDRGSLEDSYRVQARALLEEGVDGLLLETCQDPLQIRAGLDAIREESQRLGLRPVLCVSVSMEVTGRLLSGASLGDVLVELRGEPLDLLALNCATGPREMDEHLRGLAEEAPFRLGVYPNAGLPQVSDGQVQYALTPSELALWLTRFVEEDGVSVVGGCCGTTPDHLRAVVASIGRRSAPAARTEAAAPAQGSPTRSEATLSPGNRPHTKELGARRIESLPLLNLVPYINEDSLFRFRWGHQRKGRSAREHERWLRDEVRPHYHQLLRDQRDLFEPVAAVGFFRARSEDDTLVIEKPGSEGPGLILELPRQNGRGQLCIADYFDAGQDQVALAVVSLGSRASDAVRERFDAGELEAKRELDGLTAEVLCALEHCVHTQLRAEWGIGHEDARDKGRLLAGGYRGTRFAFGSPALPADRLGEVLELLDGESLGLSLEDGQLCPPLTSAFLVTHHPDAHFFTL